MTLLLIPVALLLLIDLYFFQLIKTLLVDSNGRIDNLVYAGYWIFNLSLIGLVVISSNRSALPNHIRYYIFSILLLFLIPKLIGILAVLSEDIFRFGKYLTTLVTTEEVRVSNSRRKFVSQTGIVLASIPFATMLYGMVRTGFRIKTRKATVFFDDLPKSFDGLKIAQISDLHSGSFRSESFFEEAVKRINDENPDLIFFTGDLVNNEAVEAERFTATFSKLKAKYGVYSVLGNHDYGDYGPWPSAEAKADNLNRLKAIHTNAGWNILLNDSAIINRGNAQISIVGVENWGAARHFPKYGDLDKAVAISKNVPFKILLSHDPSHWDAQVIKHKEKFQLTLSGHTHGAQFGIEIPGFKWSPVQYVYKRWAGLYDNKDGQKLYVNRGLGFIGFMGRIGIPPEITMLELRVKKNA